MGKSILTEEIKPFASNAENLYIEKTTKVQNITVNYQAIRALAFEEKNYIYP
jgi:hypothetical protein